jgi:hypothetical protein
MLLKEEEEKDEAIGSEGGDTKRNPNLHLTVNPDIAWLACLSSVISFCPIGFLQRGHVPFLWITSIIQS